jgi:hypothetical protein
MAGRRSRRFLWLLLLVLAAAAVGFCRAVRDPWPVQQGIVVRDGEERDTARVVAATVALLDHHHVGGRPFTRSAFAKSHACLRASLEVPELAPRLRHGLFAHPGHYDAWLRFSSGAASVGSDERRDAHGLALKVMAVAGEKLLASEGGADTQDFVLSDSPRFPVASVREYAELVEALARGERPGHFFAGSLLPWHWRLREGWLAFRARRAAPASLLQTQYYSAAAFRLGPQQLVKYGARPCERKRSPRSDRTDDRLRRVLKDELARGDACLELTVQLQVPGKNMPVEDPTVLWSEQDSPFLPVARITIPKQAFDAKEQDRFCEDLSFTPWHSLPEHEPVGALNRLRKAVYLELSRYRHARNGSPLAEPHGFCLDLSGASCPAAAPAVAAPAGVAAPTAAARSAPAAAPVLARPAVPSPPRAPAPPAAATVPEPATVPPEPKDAPSTPPASEPSAPPASEPSPPESGR